MRHWRIYASLDLNGLIQLDQDGGKPADDDDVIVFSWTEIYFDLDFLSSEDYTKRIDWWAVTIDLGGDMVAHFSQIFLVIPIGWSLKTL